MQVAKIVTAAALAALATGHALADTTTFSEGFEDVSGLATKGWSVWNLSENPVGPGWVQGDVTMAAEDGAIDSYAMSGYRAVTGTLMTPSNISTWMVTPVIQLTGADTLNFSIQGAGAPYQDNIRVFIGPASATSADQFTEQIFGISSAPAFWLSFSPQLPENLGSSIRVAFEYYGSNGTGANYLGLDSVSVTSAVPEPEPASMLMLGLGLGGVAVLRRRKKASE